MKQHIISDPDIFGGKLVIAGTRIPVSRILFLVSDGYTPEAIHQEYPHIGVKTIEAVLDETALILDKINTKHNAPLL